MSSTPEIRGLETDGVLCINAERKHHLEKGYTAEHDDANFHNGELQSAAEAYLWAANHQRRIGNGRWIQFPPLMWPWTDEDWKPSSDRLENLTKAGSLIAAEIDRLLRAQDRKEKESNG